MKIFTFLMLLSLSLSSVLFVKADEEANTVEDTDSQDGNQDATAGDDGVIEEEGVLVLTKENFQDAALTKDIILVEFYAPWCGHCKTLAPNYAKAAQKLKDNDPPIPLGKVDATVHRELGEEYGVSGFPTLKVFRKGKVYDYEGPRDEAGIIKYMQGQASPSWKPPPEVVVSLNKDNFDTFVNSQPLVLLEFYAPWCGHCKKLGPELQKAAKELVKEDPPIVIAIVDAVHQGDLVKRFQVTGYPTMFVMRYGVKYEYEGPRDAVGIAKYMRQMAKPTSVELTTMKEVKDYIDYQDDLSVVGFFSGEDDPMYQLYVDTANAINEEYRFGYTFLEEARKLYEVSTSNIVLFHSKRYHSKYEPGRFVFDEKVNVTFDTLLVWLQRHDVPLVGQMIDSVFERWFRGQAVVIVFYGLDWSLDHKDDTQFWRHRILEVASDPEYKDYTFAIADEDEFGKFLVDLGLDDSGNEINVGLYDTKKRRYAMDTDDEFSVEGLREFLQDFKDGNLKPVIKSQPKPKDNDGPVRIIVGNTFDKEVRQTEKNVLLEIYAPWCGHCKKLEPVYKKLGKKYKDSDSVVIAKIDGTANDLPMEVQAEGFPTLFLVKGGDLENLIKFEGGERTVASLSAFIEENTTASQTKDEL
ncbi:protein disulfide-isomerase A4-like isoform X3 [Apostichopus japonicus]|uniref:protein disulfide-isomerase A4-like isoform X3 n=1 Tax=Stichopus japonicus TaxID=307972 RepID=UPI003AB3E3CF